MAHRTIKKSYFSKTPDFSNTALHGLSCGALLCAFSAVRTDVDCMALPGIVRMSNLLLDLTHIPLFEQPCPPSLWSMFALAFWHFDFLCLCLSVCDSCCASPWVCKQCALFFVCVIGRHFVFKVSLRINLGVLKSLLCNEKGVVPTRIVHSQKHILCYF